MGGIGGTQKREWDRRRESRASYIVLLKSKREKHLSFCWCCCHLYLWCQNLYISKAETTTPHDAFSWQKSKTERQHIAFAFCKSWWHIWNASKYWRAAAVQAICNIRRQKSVFLQLIFFLCATWNAYSFVRSCNATGEKHAATGSVRVIPVIAMLLWQQRDVHF